MKADPISILLYGHDEHLLETRQWVLQSRGYRTLTIVTLADIVAVPATPPVRLLLLCHSLSNAECERAIPVARLRWPGIKDLVMASDLSRTPTGILGQLLHTMDGPDRLVSMVGKLVGTRSDSPTLPPS